MEVQQPFQIKFPVKNKHYRFQEKNLDLSSVEYLLQ